ncbi:MAG: bifunctional 2-polyprenyl-6-hydroxyphenol methylase/3-demethylubiquinol 3-O-methyltransferase UbiG [Alphaproteobacteria bacterium]|nr:bifunctional 2-polyprenyl-6-hydroxyphenol methylase/3-demethylubiquinol 3-O-methyltransferase UbiG [Alphaproteobacteria bacterium]
MAAAKAKAKRISRGSTIDDDEVARFAALAEDWWDPTGPLRSLHKLNPVRLKFIRDRVANHFGRDPLDPAPLHGLRLLDIGCGGGLLCEPMRRLGASVVGIDAAERNVAVARIHAEQGRLDIDYRHGSAEDLAASGARFDVVLTMEVVEHVADVELFLSACADLLDPGGCLVAATINRTAKAFALAIVGAEYVLGWLPRGTHDWREFVRPSEMVEALRAGDVAVNELTGVIYNPINDAWSTSRDLDVNYMAFATKPAGGD